MCRLLAQDATEALKPFALESPEHGARHVTHRAGAALVLSQNVSDIHGIKNGLGTRNKKANRPAMFAAAAARLRMSPSRTRAVPF